LYRVGNLDELWLEINLPQERVKDVNVGDKVRIENTDTQAVITLMGQSVSSDNQSVLARAVIKGKQNAVRAGQKVNIQLVQDSQQAAFSLPASAIAQNEGKSFVFLQNPAGFKVCPVEIIGRQGNEAIIRGELTGNESIAVTGAVALKANWLGLGSE
jgi:cobalt-zinc-cadmium efflux system membrane fusion protein